MIDTHCHLSFPQFDDDRDDVLARAKTAGITKIINPGSDLEQSRSAVRVASLYDNVWASVGIHPKDAESVSEEVVRELHRLSTDTNVVGIGEIGLEKSNHVPEMDVQLRALTMQMELSPEPKLPYIFHVRDCHEEFRNFITSRTEKIRGVMHCFTGTVDDAKWYVSKGLYIGITGIVTFPNAETLRDVVRVIPLDSLLIETDAPFLTPQQHRGKRNEPAYVNFVAEEIAKVKNVSKEEVDRVTTLNAEKLFSV